MARGLGKFIGGITFGVSMDTRKLQKNIKSARKRIAGFVRSVKNTTLAIGGLSGAIGAVGFAKFTTDAFLAIDSLAKVSDKLGLTTEALAGLRLAAEESGVASNTLDMALQRMVRRVAEAAEGTGEAKMAIKELGLDARELARLSPDQQFLAISDAMKGVRDSGQQVRLAFKLFDSEGVSLINTLRMGRAEIEETTRTAGSLGLAVSRAAARGVERAIDSFNEFRSALKGIFMSIAVEIAPVIEGLSAKMTRFLAVGEKGKTAGRAIGSAIVNMAKIVADSAQLGFAALLDFVADGKQLFRNISNSQIGGFLGLEKRQDRAGRDEIFNLRHRAFTLRQDEQLPSRMIDKIIAENTKAIAKETASNQPSTFGDMKRLFSNLLGQGRNNVASFGQIGQGIGGLPFVRALPALLGNLINARQSGIQFGADSTMRASLSSSRLAALQKGTSEAFAASRRNVNGRQQTEAKIERNTGQAAVELAKLNGNFNQLVDRMPRERGLA